MSTDLSFITNEKNQRLLDRFKILIKDTAFFDCLVGYFYISGFYRLYPVLDKTQKIRVLIGIGTDFKTADLVKRAKDEQEPLYSHYEVKEAAEESIEEEMAESDDSYDIEQGVSKFMEWIKSNKLEIRAYPERNIHSKLYIMTFREGDRDVGRVITGSSNFTYGGLVDNLEFNVELKNRSDYEFARQKFEELWKQSVDIGETYIKTIQERTWFKENISPYHLYLKFLYEYFKEELSRSKEMKLEYVPRNFKYLEYQEQAVLNAKKILLEYGGVFISDVVGLGKTYIVAMLLNHLDGRTLVIAPPSLVSESNPGSWKNVLSDFKVAADYCSIGKLDSLLEKDYAKYENIVIDEAHRFRTETTLSYEMLAKICRGKKLIFVTATPYNNRPGDILSLLKLFQSPAKSTIPNLPNIEHFFSQLENKLKKIDRRTNSKEYLEAVKNVAKEIREKVLKYLMIRRTRAEIEKYYPKDIEGQKIKFPKVEKPHPLLYELNEEENKIFDQTVEIITKQLTYARYMPLLYLKEPLIDQLEKQSQRNMGAFMKVLLIKRLESSFYAFRKSIERFINSYTLFLKALEEDGWVYISKKHSARLFELLAEDNDEAIQKLIEENKAERYSANSFDERLKSDLKQDIKNLKKIRDLWLDITRDPKLTKLKDELSKSSILKDKHIIIFTESKETAEYLVKELNKNYPNEVLLFTGSSPEEVRDRVIANFDANALKKENRYRILVSTEVLAEGVNLHRSNIVINYDIPWNPTRMRQRVGRVNRINTEFDEIHIFNFFPTVQSNDEIQLKETAEAKIHAFLTLLGDDAELLTEGEPIGSHELFDKLTSTKVFEEDELEESELKYLQIIYNVQETNPQLFETIKKLPRKARSAKRLLPAPCQSLTPPLLLTFFRKGRLMKFFLAHSHTHSKVQELDFTTAAKIFESEAEEKKCPIALEKYYQLLEQNKKYFLEATSTEETIIENPRKSGMDSSQKLLKILKAIQQNTQSLTDTQEDILKQIITALEEGDIPKRTARQTLNALNALKDQIENPLKVISTLQAKIDPSLLKKHYSQTYSIPEGKREVILSLYLEKDEKQN